MLKKEMKPDTAFSQKTRVLILNNFQHRQSQKMPPAFFFGTEEVVRKKIMKIVFQ